MYEREREGGGEREGEEGVRERKGDGGSDEIKRKKKNSLKCNKLVL